MLPTSLRFELLPRRTRPWLRAVLAGTCALAVGMTAVGWWQWEQEIERIERDASEALAHRSKGAAATSASPQAVWTAAVQQDGSLFALNVNARLLEIERCTTDHATVIRVVHTADLGVTRFEASLKSGGALVPLLECLNVSATSDRRWRLMSVASSGADQGPFSASLRYE